MAQERERVGLDCLTGRYRRALGRRLESFTRLETPGANAPNGNNDMRWVKVLVKPRSRGVFSFQPRVVPGNREAVPTP